MADDAPSSIDPDGRLVVFDAGSHLHLAQGNRSWLLDHIETILDTIARPDYREDDPRAGRERFYRQNALTPRLNRPGKVGGLQDSRGGSGRWMRVVLDCNDVPSWVVTVLIQDDDPRPHQVQ